MGPSARPCRKCSLFQIANPKNPLKIEAKSKIVRAGFDTDITKQSNPLQITRFEEFES